MPRLEAEEVMIVLKGGKTLHFLSNEGDKLIVSEENTYTKYNSGDVTNHYYNITVTPNTERS